MPRVVEETPLTLSPDYRPSSDEAFMGPTMLEYFRKKLEHWRLELLNESNHTLQSLQEGGTRKQISLTALPSNRNGLWSCVPATAPAS